MRIRISEADKEWLEDVGINLDEVKQIIPLIIFTLIVFIGIILIFPHTPMYKQAKYPYLIRINNPPEISISPEYLKFMEQTDDIWQK